MTKTKNLRFNAACYYVKSVDSVAVSIFAFQDADPGSTQNF
jgi:hypothetical protein